MDLAIDDEGAGISITPEAPVILLDTNAWIWLVQGHRRATTLQKRARLHISPASLLELQFLVEAGRLRLRDERFASSVADDPRVPLDEPAAGRWFAQASEESWTRDPFDRLLVAHARLRGWSLATGDALILEHLRAGETVPL